MYGGHCSSSDPVARVSSTRQDVGSRSEGVERENCDRGSSGGRQGDFHTPSIVKWKGDYSRPVFTRPCSGEDDTVGRRQLNRVFCY